MSLTYRTRCFWCEAEVYYHTNGNGDHVLIDDLTGAPWPIHDCWEAYSRPRNGTQRKRERQLRQLSELREIAEGNRPIALEPILGESVVDRIQREAEARRQARRDYQHLKSVLRNQRLET